MQQNPGEPGPFPAILHNFTPIFRRPVSSPCACEHPEFQCVDPNGLAGSGAPLARAAAKWLTPSAAMLCPRVPPPVPSPMPLLSHLFTRTPRSESAGDGAVAPPPALAAPVQLGGGAYDRCGHLQKVCPKRPQ